MISKVDVDFDITDDFIVSNGSFSGGLSSSINGSTGTGFSTTGSGYSYIAANNSIGSSQLGTIELMEPVKSDSAILSDTNIFTTNPAGDVIQMTLKPEGSITAFEALMLTQLLLASMTAPHSFNAYNYVVKNNLERHFKFTAK